MKYFTSYYAKYSMIPKSYMCVAVSRTWPVSLESNQNFTAVKNNFLAPSAELLNDMKSGAINEDEYTKRYITEVMTRVQTDQKCQDLYEWIKKVEKTYATFQVRYDAIVFMCYEKPGDFCHRHLLARLLTNIYGVECTELAFQKPDKPAETSDTADTISLF